MLLFNWCTMLNLLRNMYVELVCWYHEDQWKTSALSKQHFRRLRILLSNLISCNKFCLQCNFTKMDTHAHSHSPTSDTATSPVLYYFNAFSIQAATADIFDIVKFWEELPFFCLVVWKDLTKKWKFTWNSKVAVIAALWNLKW